MNVLALTDNPDTLSLAQELQTRYGKLDIYQSPDGRLSQVPALDIKTSLPFITSNYSLVLSIHCKQIFPAALVSQIRCVNVHPGFNPDNRGWYPHVFSMINGKRAGVTIHEIDEHIDHGPIITQREYAIKPWETSDGVYANLLKIERELLIEWFPKIRDRNYTTYLPGHEGNLNTKKDYEALKQLNLERIGKLGDFINLLRGLSHEGFQNAYFVDAEGNRIYVKVILEKGHAD